NQLLAEMVAHHTIMDAIDRRFFVMLFIVFLYHIPILFVMFIIIMMRAIHDRNPLRNEERIERIMLIRWSMKWHMICVTLMFTILHQPILVAVSLAMDAHHLYCWFVKGFEDDENIHTYFDWITITYLLFFVFTLVFLLS
ncbi:hypothetical protein PFISCL1PPCAC_173, partial [Pristionchus fissidentatus]